MSNTTTHTTTTPLSPAAEKANRRIRVLQVLTERTGLQTREEQFKILMALEDADCLAVAAIMQREMRNRQAGR